MFFNQICDLAMEMPSWTSLSGVIVAFFSAAGKAGPVFFRRCGMGLAYFLLAEVPVL